jgi:co-chaperonin GroES (HSP10)
LKPFGDKIKVKIEKDEFGFGGEVANTESGIVLEVPDKIAYFGFHSFAFESSLSNDDVLEKVLKFYQDLKGKTVYWESLQDRGRRFKEGDEEFVILNMSDIIAYSDDVNNKASVVNQAGSAGTFNLS